LRDDKVTIMHIGIVYAWQPLRDAVIQSQALLNDGWEVGQWLKIGPQGSTVGLLHHGLKFLSENGHQLRIFDRMVHHGRWKFRDGNTASTNYGLAFIYQLG